jgi:hypothetical protein
MPLRTAFPYGLHIGAIATGHRIPQMAGGTHISHIVCIVQPPVRPPNTTSKTFSGHHRTGAC